MQCPVSFNPLLDFCQYKLKLHFYEKFLLEITRYSACKLQLVISKLYHTQLEREAILAVTFSYVSIQFIQFAKKPFSYSCERNKKYIGTIANGPTIITY